MAADGISAPRALLGPAATGASIGADWSPDGTMIAFQLFEAGSSSLWIADVPDPSAPFDLEARRISPSDVGAHARGSWQGPRWSPNGSMLATLVADADFATKTDVVVILPDGSKLWRPVPDDLRAGDETDAGWDPEGGKLALSVLAAPTGSNTDGYAPYQVVAGDGTTEPVAAQLRSAPPASGWVRPLYSPDGSRLAYRQPSPTSDGDAGELYVHDLSHLSRGGEVSISAAGPGETDWQPLVAELPPGQAVP